MEQTQKVFYLETDSQNPYYNLAFEEYVLTHRLEGEYLLLWQNDNTIVVGQNQNTEAEINRPFVEEHHINVVRRSTGGGAVYHDLGNLNYSFITDAGELQELAMQRFTAPVVEALKGLGLNAEASGRNDILVEGRKVSGTAQRVSHGRILHHGTLLFDSDPGAVEGGWNEADTDKIVDALNEKVEQGMINISMNTTPTFQNSSSAGNLMIVNESVNNYPQVVEIHRNDTGEVIYKSGAIPVGSKLETAKLSADLDAGTYECTALFYNVDPDSGEYLGCAGAVITVTVLE